MLKKEKTLYILRIYKAYFLKYITVDEILTEILTISCLFIVVYVNILQRFSSFLENTRKFKLEAYNSSDEAICKLEIIERHKDDYKKICSVDSE